MDLGTGYSSRDWGVGDGLELCRISLLLRTIPNLVLRKALTFDTLVRLM